MITGLPVLLLNVNIGYAIFQYLTNTNEDANIYVRAQAIFSLASYNILG